MTIPSDNRYRKYTPIVPTSAFAVGFPIFSFADLKVFVAGIETPYFSVTGTFSEGRSVNAQIALVTPASGVDVEIYGARTPARTGNYPNNSPNLAENLQIDADVLTAVQQEQARDFGRSIRVPVSEAGGAELPPAAERANKFFGFDALGNVVLSLLGPTGAPVSSYIASFLTSNNAASARSSIEAAGLPSTQTFSGKNTFSDEVTIASDKPIVFGVSRLVELLYSTVGNKWIGRATAATTWLSLRFSNFEINNFDNTKSLIRGLLNGAIELYFNGLKRLETDSAGVVVTGRLRETDRDAESWHEASRLPGTWYQNTTGRMIRVTAYTETSNSFGSLQLSVNTTPTINAICVVTMEGTGSGRRNTVYADVPAGHYYRYDVSGGVSLLKTWELS